MISFQNIIKKRATSLPENRLLRCTFIKHTIKVQLQYFLFEVQGNSMINQFKRSFRELVPKRSVTDIHFDLARVLLLIHLFRSAHNKAKCEEKDFIFYQLTCPISAYYYSITQMRGSSQYNSNKQNNQLFLNQNVIAKNKRQSESDFRVHFTIMNVKWKIKDPQKQQKLVDYIFATLNSICAVHICQISSVIDDDTYDLSVGFSNDLQAFKYLRKRSNISLVDGMKQQYQLKPIISRPFQSYINKKEKDHPELEPATLTTNNKNMSVSHQSVRKQAAQDAIKLKIYQSEQNEKLEKEQMQSEQLIKGKYMISNFKQRYYESKKDKEVSKILAFGIPKQFTISEIKQSLQSRGISIGECRWKHKQHMQYLQIELISPMARNNIYLLGLEIEGYPYIVIPQTPQNQITRQLSKYTVEIITRPTTEEEEKLIRCMRDIGGINIMIRTPVKDKQDYRYVVVFNNVDKAEKACVSVKEIHECQAHRKQYQLRVGRLNKYYTFQALMQDTSSQ